jgi:hypothetical protein
MIINIIIVALVIIYLIILYRHICFSKKKEEAISNLIEEKPIVLFKIEKRLYCKIHLSKKKMKIFVYTMRLLFVVLCAFLFMQLSSVALFFITAIFIILYFDNLINKEIDEAGVNYIADMNGFLDMYIPAVASGSSNNQAMLKYVYAMDDKNLSDWWLNKDNHTIKIDNKWKRMIEVYEMMKYNEEMGIDDSLDSIEELQKDLTNKDKFYNDYKGKMGEIKPTVISYYICLPLLLLMSFSQNRPFWCSLNGYIVIAILIVVFIMFEFCIYKLKKSVIHTIF